MLHLKKICKSFGDVQANKDIDLEICSGEIHALLGENGAGKTTLMNILYGIYQADAGEVLIDGRPGVIHSPKDAIAQRIGMVHQHFMLVPTLTVSQNITLGIKEKGYPFTDRRAVDQKISDLSREYGLDVKPRDLIRDLSVGERQRVEIIKLLYHRARLLILDEPTAVLTPQETDNLFKVLRRLKADGRSVVIITHRIGEVLSIADRVTVLRDGQTAGSMDIRDIDGAGLSRMMIGRDLTPAVRSGQVAASSKGISPVLRLEDIRLNGPDGPGKPVLDHLCMDIMPGEILGLAGVEGNGQKELAEIIVGIRSPHQGGILFKGNDVTRQGVRRRKRNGMAYIPDDRHNDGLILDMDLTANLVLNRCDSRPFARFGVLNKKAWQARAREAVTAFQVKTPGPGTPVAHLSGGNQQKIILARELDGSPDLIVASQPTRGLDIGAEQFVSQTLLEQRQKGAGVLLISADLEQLTALSDRIAVIFEGRIIGIQPNDETIEPAAIGLMMAGITGAAS